MGLVQKAFSDIITFSRSSNATRIGPDGLVQYAPHNLLTYSEQFDNAAWTKGDTTVTANAIAAPNGTITADKLNETATTAIHQLYSSISASAQSYTWSVYARAGERTVFSLGFSGATARFAWFDLSSGTLVSATNCTATITNVGNSWYRCTLTATAAAETTYPQIFLGTTASGYAPSYAGTAGSGIFIWGAQLAVGPLALDYTPTTTAAVYGPRFDYDGSGVTSVDPIARNLVLYSEQFDNAAWSKTVAGDTITANAGVAPDGTTTADKLIADTTSSAGHRLSQSVSTSGVHTLSVYAKAAGYSSLVITSSANNWVYFNLAAGTVSSSLGTGWSAATITDAGNGWYRCTATTSSSNTSYLIGVFNGVGTNGNSAPTFAGNGTDGILLWGAQLEIGSTATGYMVSGATNGFRAVPVVTGNATARGLLIEEQRTNSITYSENIASGVGAWTVEVGSLSSSVTVAPSGTVSSSKVTPNTTSSGSHRLLNNTIAFQSATYSVFVKADGYSRVALRESQVTGSAIGFDLSNQTIITTYSSGACTASNGTIQSVGNGWYRISATFTFATSTNQRFGLYLVAPGWTSGDPESVAWAGDGTSGVLVWGAQMEAGSFATSYIPTLASTVTRSADVASVNTLSPWHNSVEGTLYAEGDFLSVTAGSSGAVALGDGTANENMAVYKFPSIQSMYSEVLDGGVSQATFTQSFGTQIFKSAFAYKANDLNMATNGVAGTTDTSGTIPTVTTMFLGTVYSTTSLPMNGHLRRVAFYPRRLTNAELQALSA